MMHPLTVEEIGTDPTAAVNFINKTIDLHMLGLDPQAAAEGMRTLLENDLNGKTDAYAKDILRLVGKNTIIVGSRNEEIPTVGQIAAETRKTLRDEALKIAQSSAKPVAQ